ncbi:hypothetical protein D3C84_337100 [compost metagenome]|jgi:hypothetical protein
MIENTQATKPNSTKLLKELESWRAGKPETELERQHKALKAQIELLRETLNSLQCAAERPLCRGFEPWARRSCSGR